MDHIVYHISHTLYYFYIGFHKFFFFLLFWFWWLTSPSFYRHLAILRNNHLSHLIFHFQFFLVEVGIVIFFPNLYFVTMHACRHTFLSLHRHKRCKRNGLFGFYNVVLSRKITLLLSKLL